MHRVRGIRDTAPYFHNNSAATLEDVVDHYTEFFKRVRVNVPGNPIPAILTTDGLSVESTACAGGTRGTPRVFAKAVERPLPREPSETARRRAERAGLTRLRARDARFGRRFRGPAKAGRHRSKSG